MARYIRNYEVIRELGAGNFGTVYAAVGEVPGRGLSAGKRRLVAIKKLKDGASEQSRDLLRQEFALLDQVKHRGIVRVFEYIPEENAVVLEYVHGVTVRKLLEECARAREQVFTEAAVEILCELADALYQAYTTPGDNGEALHLVHRDLKPDNIMITPQGEVKILDFGLARVGNKEWRREETDRIKGTPIYMAPEQARGQDVDHRSDLFSLGLIAYELFMNRPAYVLPKNSIDPLGDIYDAIERGVLQDECKELESKLPGIGPILTRLLSASPKARYQTGQDLLVDLRRQLYRDRGSYLKEFAEFFYGSIFDLADPPNPDDVGKGAAPGGGGGGGKRMSMEERLKASMAREAQGRKAASQPSTWKGGDEAGGSPKGKAQSWEPASTRPARKVGEDGIPKLSDKAKKGPAKMVGARSPDETGMLPMMSLGQGIELEESSGDPSATAFFAIPAPKEANRARPTATPAAPPPTAPSAPPGGGMGPVGGGPVGPMGGVQGPVAVQGPLVGGVQGPVAVQGPMAGGIQGPVVGAYGSNAGTPFQVSTPPPPAESDSRTQSNLVYAILLAMFALVGVAIVVALYLKPAEDKPEQVAVVDPNKDKPSRPEPREDTGQDKPPPPTPTPAPSAPKTPRAPSTPSAPKAPSTPSGMLRVTLTAGGATSFEVTCPSGYRDRAALNGGSGSLNGVPAEGCTLYFKGGAPAQFAPVRGGQSITCAIQATTAVCK